MRFNGTRARINALFRCLRGTPRPSNSPDRPRIIYQTLRSRKNASRAFRCIWQTIDKAGIIFSLSTGADFNVEVLRMATKKKSKSKAKKKKKAAPARKAVSRKKIAPGKKKKAAPKKKAKAAPRAKAAARKPAPAPAAPAAPPGMERIGIVTHYYNHLSVAIIELETGSLRVGDVIHIRGHTSDFSQPVESLEIEHTHVDEVGPGESFGLRVKDHAREHDVVYKAR
jgi:hypothetical protein